MSEYLRGMTNEAARNGINLVRRVPGVRYVMEQAGIDRDLPPDPSLAGLAGNVAIIGSSLSVLHNGQRPTEEVELAARILEERQILGRDVPIKITSMVPETAGLGVVRDLGNEATRLAAAIEDLGYPKPLVNEVPVVVRADGSNGGAAHDALSGLRRHYDLLKYSKLRVHRSDNPKVLALGNIMHFARVFHGIHPGRYRPGRPAVLTTVGEPPEKSRFLAN